MATMSLEAATASRMSCLLDLELSPGRTGSEGDLRKEWPKPEVQARKNQSLLRRGAVHGRRYESREIEPGPLNDFV